MKRQALWILKDELFSEAAFAQPTANGYGFHGAEDLTKKTLWNPTTLTFDEVGEES